MRHVTSLIALLAAGMLLVGASEVASALGVQAEAGFIDSRPPCPDFVPPPCYEFPCPPPSSERWCEPRELVGVTGASAACSVRETGVACDANGRRLAVPCKASMDGSACTLAFGSVAEADKARAEVGDALLAWCPASTCPLEVDVQGGGGDVEPNAITIKCQGWVWILCGLVVVAIVVALVLL